VSQKIVVVGANCSGSVAAGDLAAMGFDVLMLERDLKRKKPCGGAIPPQAMTEFGIPESIIERKVRRAVVVGPSGRTIEMDVRGSVESPEDYIVMVTREILDRTMREKAQNAGAELREASFVSHEEQSDGRIKVKIRYRDGREETVVADALIGADGAGSQVAKSAGRAPVKHASAIQERLQVDDEAWEYYATRAELYLGDDVSPDFYGWAFPKSDHIAVGTGCKPEHANRSYAFLEGVKQRAGGKLRNARRILLEGHPLPMQRYKKLVYGRALLVGDAAGAVAHTSGEGIYFAMAGGRLAAQTIHGFFGYQKTGLDRYQKLWQKRYGAMFDFLEFLENISYTSNFKREFFVDMCDVETVQKLTFDSYLFKQMAHVKPQQHVNLALNAARAAMGNFLHKRSPLLSEPPNITAKEALALTRIAVTSGTIADEKTYVTAQ
jgi:geranylgeranyl reductase